MSEAVKKEYQEKLGEDFGTVLYEVGNDRLTGLVRLKEYRVLFSDHDAVKLLNAAGGGCMWDVQQILWHDLLLHVTRLTDPATMGGHQNLSVRALPPFCEQPELQAEYPELQAEVQTLVDRAVTAADAPRDWRNRRISHTDLGLAIDPEAESLAPTSLGQVQTALDAVHAVIQTIVGQVVKYGIANDVIVQPRAGAFLNAATEAQPIYLQWFIEIGQAAVYSLMHNSRSDWNGRLQPCLDGRQFARATRRKLPPQGWTTT